MSDFVIGKSQKSHIKKKIGGGGNFPKNVCTLLFYSGLNNFLLSIYQTHLEFIYKRQIEKKGKSQKSHNYLIHFWSKMPPK